MVIVGSFPCIPIFLLFHTKSLRSSRCHQFLMRTLYLINTKLSQTTRTSINVREHFCYIKICKLQQILSFNIKVALVYIQEYSHFAVYLLDYGHEHIGGWKRWNWSEFRQRHSKGIELLGASQWIQISSSSKICRLSHEAIGISERCADWDAFVNNSKHCHLLWRMFVFALSFGN